MYLTPGSYDQDVKTTSLWADLIYGLYINVHIIRKINILYNTPIRILYSSHFSGIFARGSCRACIEIKKNHYVALSINMLSSAKSGPGTGLLLSRKCLSHDTTYFRTFVRTFESRVVSWLSHSRENNRPVHGHFPTTGSLKPVFDR